MLAIREGAIVDFVRAAYAGENRTIWRTQMLDAAMGLIDGVDSAIAGTGTTEWVPGGLRLTRFDASFLRGPNTFWSDDVLAQYGKLPPPMLEQMYGRTHGNVASDSSTAAGIPPELMWSHPAWTATWTSAVRDTLGIVQREADGRLEGLFVGLPTATPLAPKVRLLLNRLAAHFAAGARLVAQETSIESAEAVLTPTGQLLDAKPLAQERRSVIDDGFQRRVKANERGLPADQALEIWRGLVGGRWSLVDVIDTDGKRLVLAMKNAPAVAPRQELTPRERRVAAMAAMGLADKEIAYQLGLTVATVTTALRRARLKLGVETRAELAAHWRGGATDEEPP